MRNALGLGVMIAACLVWSAAMTATEEFSGKVTSVSSGHIIQVEHDGKSDLVVLAGIASPDSKTPEGKLAKAFTANRAMEQDVKVQGTKRTGRVVTGTVFMADGKDLAELVLSEGMATFNNASAPENTRYRDIEAGAKMQKLGLWGMQTSKPATAAGKPATRIAPATPAKTDAKMEETADGKKPKLVLKGDADVAEAARAQFEREKQVVADQRARQAAEQEKQIAEEERRMADQQKKEEDAMARAELQAAQQQGLVPMPNAPIQTAPMENGPQQ